jgi:hypothetical protein
MDIAASYSTGFRYLVYFKEITKKINTYEVYLAIPQTTLVDPWYSYLVLQNSPLSLLGSYIAKALGSASPS